MVSVVIPAFNEEARLPESLRRIRDAFSASPSLTYELIVCDNNSADATASVAASAGCRVVFEPINQISRARNRGAEAAKGEWILLIDADSWPPPELVGDLILLIANSGCIGAGSTIRVIDGPRWFKYVWESKNWSMRTFKWCPGAFILCRHDAFTEVGGFSEEHYIFEESDFTNRLKALGRRRGQKFFILHEHPFRTSGRRANALPVSGWLVLALKLIFAHKHTVRDGEFAKKWYKPQR